MKKILLTAVIVTMAVTITFANNNVNGKDGKENRKEMRKERRAERKNEVSYFTKSQFTFDFPKATDVRFAKTNNFDEVYFVSDSKTLKAFYDVNSKLVGTVQEADFTELPANAQKQIRGKYADYNVAKVVKFDDNENNDMDMNLYETPFEDEDNYFVELKSPNKEMVVKVDLLGNVSFFKKLQ